MPIQTELGRLREELELERSQKEKTLLMDMERLCKAQKEEMAKELETKALEDVREVRCKLNEEHQLILKEMQQTQTDEIKRLREKYERHLDDMESDLASKETTLSKLKERLMQLEELIIVLRANIKHREQRIEEVEQSKSHLDSQRSNLRSVVAQEFEQELKSMADEKARLMREMHNMRTKFEEINLKHEQHVECLENDYQKEAKQIHQRLKAALAKKDESEAQLRADLVLAEQRIEHLQAALNEEARERLSKASAANANVTNATTKSNNKKQTRGVGSNNRLTIN